MLKVILIAPTGAKVETVYAEAQHYSLVHQRDGSHLVGIYDAKPQTTRSAMLAAGLLEGEDDEEYQLTEEQKAALRPGKRLAMIYVATGFCLEFDLRETLPAKTFAVRDIRTDGWVIQSPNAQRVTFVAKRRPDCELATYAAAKDCLDNLCSAYGESSRFYQIVDSDGNKLETEHETYAIYSENRGRWVNRRALTPEGRFVRVRDIGCEFRTHEDAMLELKDLEKRGYEDVFAVIESGVEKVAEAKPSTFAIYAVERDRWYNRNNRGPGSEFVPFREPNCEFLTRAEAEEAVEALNDEEIEGESTEKFEIFESGGRE